MKKLNVCLALMVAMMCGCSARALNLVKDGRAVSTIVVPDAANPAEQAGAERLAMYLRLSSGAELPIVKEGVNSVKGTIISVGRTQLAKEAGINDEGLKYDGYLLVAKNGTLYVLGRDTEMLRGQNTTEILAGAQGTTRAAFGLLDRLGFRWLQPTPMGTYVPELKTISVPDDLNVKYEPPLMYMHGRMHNWGDWSMANSARTAIKSFTTGGHTWGPSISSALFKTHPEYFVLMKGQRLDNGQYCSSNPDAQKLVAEWTMKILAQGYEMVALGQSDGFQPCECPLCAKLSAANQVHNAHRNIIEMIGKKYPDRKVQVLIYPPTNDPPTQFESYPPNTVVELCLTGSLRDSFGSYEKALSYWQKFAPSGITVYSYEMGTFFEDGLTGRFYPKQAAAKLKLWLEHNVKGIYWCGGGEKWGTEGSTYYVIGRLATDPTLDWQKIYEEYLTLTFRKAAPAMKEYYDLLYSRWEKFRNPVYDFILIGDVNPDDTFVAVYSPQVLADLEAQLSKAKKAAEGDEKALGWIRLAEVMHNHSALIAKAFHLYRAYTLNPTPANMAQVRDAVMAYRAWVDSTAALKDTDKAFYENFFPDNSANDGSIWTKKNLVESNFRTLKCRPFNMNFDDGPAEASDALKDPVASGWTLQFSDDFDRAELGDDWSVTAGDWKIVNGTLAANHPRGESCKIVCTSDFQGSQRLEYDAWTDRPGDLSGILAADTIGRWDSGYFFGFGSDRNLASKLFVNGVDTKFYDGMVAADKVHHVVCQREGDMLTHIVDGKVLMTHKDPKPLKGEGHQRVALYIWVRGNIDNVKVYTKPE